MWFVTACAAATLLAFGVASVLVGGVEHTVAGVRISVRHVWQPMLMGGVLAGAALPLCTRIWPRAAFPGTSSPS